MLAKLGKEGDMPGEASLFGGARPKNRLHPSFQTLKTSEANKSTRRMMNDAFARYVEKDGNFVEQFQTTGFNTRTFELYVSELLYSEGFTFEGTEPHPDFCVTKNGIKVAIECTTANPTDEGKGSFHVYEPVNEKDLDVEGLKLRQENEVPIRIAGALRNKMLHRVNKKDPKAYWELAHVAGNPFVLAVQTFHEHGSLSFSNAAAVRYLYGIEQTASWDEAGKMIIKTEQIHEHTHDGKVIPSGFFNQPEVENVSAVLWTNAGTVAKFSRMALGGPYPDENLTYLRYGSMFDFDPDANAPLPFAYIVGDPDTPVETWGQEANLFHNPKARHPIADEVFETVTNSRYVDGTYTDLIKGDFSPIMSMSMSVTGVGHRQAAIRHGEKIIEILSKSYRQMNKRPAAPTG
jgi:hypothetical protein